MKGLTLGSKISPEKVESLIILGISVLKYVFLTLGPALGSIPGSFSGHVRCIVGSIIRHLFEGLLEAD